MISIGVRGMLAKTRVTLERRMAREQYGATLVAPVSGDYAMITLLPAFIGEGGNGKNHRRGIWEMFPNKVKILWEYEGRMTNDLQYSCSVVRSKNLLISTGSS